MLNKNNSIYYVLLLLDAWRFQQIALSWDLQGQAHLITSVSAVFTSFWVGSFQ